MYKIKDYTGLNKQVLQTIAQEAGISTRTQRTITIRWMTPSIEKKMRTRLMDTKQSYFLNGVFCPTNKTYRIYINPNSHHSFYKIVAHELKHVAQYTTLDLKIMKNYATMNYDNPNDHPLEIEAIEFAKQF